MKAYFKKYKLRSYQVLGLGLFLFFGIFHQFIAHEVDARKSNQSISTSLPALIPYSSQTLDSDNRGLGPFDKQNVSSLYYRHWLGTDALGRDVLAGLIHGSHIALKVGFWSGVVALIIGLFFGFLSGYYGDNGFLINKWTLIFFVVISAICVFYAYYLEGIKSFLILLLPVFFLLLNNKFDNSVLSQKVNIPLDLIVLKILETFRSVPRLFLLLVFLSLFYKPGFLNVILVIALLRWPIITRHVRAEVLKLKGQKFILSAKAIGQKDWRIFKNHILPLCISPISILIAFGFSAAILTESTLSFLGIGIPIDQVTWGSMLSEARKSLNLWWLAIFPGLMIYFVMSLFNSIGDTISAYFQKTSNLSA